MLIKKLLLLVSCLLILSNSAFALTQWCDDANILGCWTFEGSAANSLLDVSSKNNDLTNTNTVSFTSGSKCFDSSKCYEFDGGNDRYLSVTSNDFDITTGDLTVVAYIYPDTFGQNSFGRIVDFLDATAGLKGWSFYLEDAATADSIRFEKQTPGVIVQGDASVISTLTLQHVAAVKNGTNLKIYVDGVQKVNDTLGDITSDTGGDLRIGIRGDDEREFDGGIDEVAAFGDAKDSTDLNDILDNGLVQSAEPTGAPSQIW